MGNYLVIWDGKERWGGSERGERGEGTAFREGSHDGGEGAMFREGRGERGEVRVNRDGAGRNYKESGRGQSCVKNIFSVQITSPFYPESKPLKNRNNSNIGKSQLIQSVFYVFFCYLIYF